MQSCSSTTWTAAALLVGRRREVEAAPTVAVRSENVVSSVLDHIETSRHPAFGKLPVLHLGAWLGLVVTA